MLSTFEQKLENYASLIVEVGANIQKDQTLYISASIETVELVRKVADKAYTAGARNVIVDWADDELTKIRYKKAPAESFSEFPEWKVLEREKLAEAGAAVVSIVSQSPDLLKGVEPSRIADAQKAAGKALSNYRKLMMADHFSWSVVAAPSKAWAAKMFPELAESDQVPALWEAIFKAVRADQEDAVGVWKELDRTLNEKADYLNQKAYAKLHYTAPGTDLTIELPKGHIWCGGGSVNIDGNAFMANMPTEEVFTVPHKTGVNGYVKNTKPLSYGGNIIDDFTISFENGRITEVKAEQGEEVLQRLVDTDEGAKHLGEVALVPHASPISESGLLFYNTLFDENASNHLAIGSAYSFCIEGGKTMSSEELAERGLNESITHVDFMIGSADMDIDGVLEDGTVEPVFRNGNWAF